MMARLRRYWGIRPFKRHSLILTVAGLIYSLISFSFMISDLSPKAQQSLYVLLQIAPPSVWGVIFLTLGIMTVVSSIWPPFADTWGYMILTGLSTSWSATYLAGVLFFHTPASNVSQALLWGLLGFMWWAVSGLINPDEVMVIENDGG